MRARRAIAIAAACSLASCSLVTSWDGLTKKNTGGSSSSSSGATTTASSSTSSATGMCPQSSSAGPCMVPGLYCGCDKLNGDPTRLYQCQADGTGNLYQVCTYGCTVRAAGHDDNCHCEPNALYCGGDKIDGDMNTLYKCQPGATMPTFVMKCPTKCVINTSANDSCT